MSKRWSEMDDLELLQLECEMRDDLHGLHTTATAYADRVWERGGSKRQPEPVRPGGLGWLGWSAACLTAVLLAAGAARWTHPASPAVAREAGHNVTVNAEATPAISDEALLQQIQTDLASGVPAAMEPLQASTDSHGSARGVNR